MSYQAARPETLAGPKGALKLVALTESKTIPLLVTVIGNDPLNTPILVLAHRSRTTIPEPAGRPQLVAYTTKLLEPIFQLAMATALELEAREPSCLRQISTLLLLDIRFAEMQAGSCEMAFTSRLVK